MSTIATTIDPSTTDPGTIIPARRQLPWLPDLAMIRAERIKLSKRRGLMAASAVLAVGSMIVTFGILIALHASNPSKYSAAGGVGHLSNVTPGLLQATAVVAILIGATAGAGDISAGVFRNLVVTGRSRLSLFLARIPGALQILLPLVAVGFAVVAIGSTAFAGAQASPSVSLLIKDGLWIELEAVVMFLLALSVSSIMGSRSTSISVLLALELVGTSILTTLTGLPGLRQLWVGVSIRRLEPVALLPKDFSKGVLTIGGGAALAVIMVWCVASVIAGARRTMTRDA
jgi:ABC-type transport system involved in multi-copper enzyme maturation permease subunit